MSALPFQYLTLRAVPRVERGEFVNVGVVLFCDALDYLASASLVDADRLRALSPSIDLEGLSRALDAVADVCAGRPGQGRPTFERVGQRFGWLAAPRSTVLQPGPVHGGVCKDPAAELDRLLSALVG